MTTFGSQSASRLISLCAVTDVPQGGVIQVEKDGLSVAVFHLGNHFYVTDNRCTHGPGLLCEGDIDGDVVVCNFHNGAFHIPTGRVEKPPCKVPVRTYRVHIAEDLVCIDPDAHAG